MAVKQGKILGETKFLSKGIDYLGSLGAKLQDLQGFKSLAHELIQNADDVPNATSMVFNIQDAALVVDNDGIFSDCHEDEKTECPWKSKDSKGHSCDFHRFRMVAGGDKRGEAETTGAFGIGFIAVYQITDVPELISGGRHWILHEEKQEHERIEECSGCSKCDTPDLPGTRFILPWAFDPNSNLRKALSTDEVSKEGPEQLYIELLKSIPTAMLFLKRLKSIKIKRTGKPSRKFERFVDGRNLIISQGNSDKDETWYLIQNDFTEVATALRSEHPGQIEKTRSSNITIAIPIDSAHTGILCACLPTEHKTNLPFHINADFFPTSDRKHIFFDTGYQAKWNEAAIEAAAQILGNSIDLLPDLFMPEELWRFLEQIKKSEKDTFGMFWNTIEPQLKTAKIIPIKKNEWVASEDAVLLSQKEEKSVIPFLEQIGLKVVDEVLRPYRRLLLDKAVGVPLLDIDRICRSFREKGIVNRIDADGWSSFFPEEPDLSPIWQEINLLLERQKSSTQRQEDIMQLQNISLAPGRDGAFWPCEQLFTFDKKTITLFNKIDENIPFVADDPDFAPLADILCTKFTVKIAIECLQELNTETLEGLLNEGKNDLSKLFDWFEARQDVILNDEDLKSEFNELRIFPSSGNLNKLLELTIPGDFDDFLGLAKIVDLKAMGMHTKFLMNLGMQKLDFKIYAKQQLPAALQNTNVSPAKRRNVIKMLANRIGEIKDDSEVRDALSKSNLVECDDGAFHPPDNCYIKSKIVTECLGKDVLLVKLPRKSQTTYQDLYEWLGVVREPRYTDLVTYIQTISQSPYSSKNRQTIENIIGYLGKRFDGEDEKESSALESLRNLAWLPAKGKIDRLYEPEEVYASYRYFIFESQADFVDISMTIQNKSSKLFEYLGIRKNPTDTLVVKHLLYCAEKLIPVNSQVYNHLNNADETVVSQLLGKKCLYLDGEYVAPNKVFWGEHRFGHYRRRLSEELRGYGKLLDIIGVREDPNYEDALNVLREISNKFGKVNSCLDDESHSVLLECWRMLEVELIAENLPENRLSSLHDVKCIPNKQQYLRPPEYVFFENRVGLAEKFGDYLKNEVITQPLGTGKVMSEAGVRSLWDAVKVELLECVDPTEYEPISGLIIERRNQLGRVLGGDQELLVLNHLDNIKINLVKSLKIRYSIDVFNNLIESEPEIVSALYHREKQSLFFKYKDDKVPWLAIARELALALIPDEDPGKNASALKEVLAADSVEDASFVLDELGFPGLDTKISSINYSGSEANTLGEEGLLNNTGDALIETSNSTSSADEVKEDHYFPDDHVITSHQSETENSEHNDGITFKYDEEFEKVFNRPGTTKIPKTAIPDNRIIRDPSKRREKEAERHQESIKSEPDPETRRRQTERVILEGPDEMVRITLKEWYDGKCQICGNTFQTISGDSFFIAKYIVERKLARQADTYANALCLCSDHFAQWQHGPLEAKDMISQINSLKLKSEGGNDILEVQIKLCGKECRIKFNEKHVIALQELLNVLKSDNIPDS